MSRCNSHVLNTGTAPVIHLEIAVNHNMWVSPQTSDIGSLRDIGFMQLRSAVQHPWQIRAAGAPVWWKPTAVTLRLCQCYIQLRHLLLRGSQWNCHNNKCLQLTFPSKEGVHCQHKDTRIYWLEIINFQSQPQNKYIHNLMLLEWVLLWLVAQSVIKTQTILATNEDSKT